MKRNKFAPLLGIAVVLAFGTALIGLAGAQPENQMPMMLMQMGSSGMMHQQPMPMDQMMRQMQQQMAQMNTTIQALRRELDKINPELLTSQQRPMYEYLKILQGHLESMYGMMGRRE